MELNFIGIAELFFCCCKFSNEIMSIKENFLNFLFLFLYSFFIFKSAHIPIYITVNFQFDIDLRGTTTTKFKGNNKSK